MKFFLASVIIFVLIVIPFSTNAIVSKSFGGKVILQKPCDEGMLLTVKSFRGTASYMWLWGNLPYLSYIPPHIGQNIVGNARVLPVPCTISGVPYAGGIPIQFHGSSR